MKFICYSDDATTILATLSQDLKGRKFISRIFPYTTIILRASSQITPTLLNLCTGSKIPLCQYGRKKRGLEIGLPQCYSANIDRQQNQTASANLCLNYLMAVWPWSSHLSSQFSYGKMYILKCLLHSCFGMICVRYTEKSLAQYYTIIILLLLNNTHFLKAHPVLGVTSSLRKKSPLPLFSHPRAYRFGDWNQSPLQALYVACTEMPLGNLSYLWTSAV